MPSDKAPRSPQAPRWRSRLHEAIQAGVEHPACEHRSSWWDRIYEQTSLEARILLGRRQQVALTWVEQLSLSQPSGSRVLEIGWGAGATAVELAPRGHLVAAWTAARPMLGRTLALPIAVIVGLAARRCWFDCG